MGKLEFYYLLLYSKFLCMEESPLNKIRNDKAGSFLSGDIE